MSTTLTTIDGPPSCVTSAEHAELTQTTPASFDSLPPICRLQLEPVKIDGHAGWENMSLKLYLTEREVGFYSAERSKTLLVPYPTISLHAISRTESGAQPCIYCQLDDCSDPEAEADEEQEAVELRIVPEDPTRLEEIFEVLSACASLHPSNMPPEEDDGFFGEVGDVDENLHDLSETGRVRTDILSPGSRFNPY
ncbi:uncharacterized protein MELLADRAFT_111193 [Melampsora larici-populina 98AG31]|uniref:Uncharacterized protein n=1 Tax=Melampsora larici-populina (strain 98AG31 / pathotype 3-4-7) TaxID=747676 RepID=F4S2B9_MELLP|nr:uncharacterized protein MELLADRAFT_111193 [Melampsora larici-populina 98AG31]EGG01229.1 hypothetical protein MELLADRAFT_111193 [Melampsora larici-populina 98AG31]